jgi:hypothetical protein
MERKDQGGRGNNERRHPKRCNMMNTVSLGGGILVEEEEKSNFTPR